MRTAKTTRLLKHTTVAKLFDVTGATLRAWVELGIFPEPHSVIGNRPPFRPILYYSAEVIDHRLRTGEWPSGTRFRGAEDQP